MSVTQEDLGSLTLPQIGFTAAIEGDYTITHSTQSCTRHVHGTVTVEDHTLYFFWHSSKYKKKKKEGWDAHIAAEAGDGWMDSGMCSQSRGRGGTDTAPDAFPPLQSYINTVLLLSCKTEAEIICL